MSAFNIKHNAVVCTTGALVVLAAQLLIFRMAEAWIGLTGIGYFALIHGLMVFARAFETGVGQNITRQIILVGSQSEKWAIIYAGLVLILGPTLILSLFSVSIIGHYVGGLQSEHDIDLTRTILTITVVISLGSASNAVCAAALDGAGMIIQRNIAQAFAYILAAISAVPLLSAFGTAGYGAIFIVASFTQLVLLIIFLLWNFSTGLLAARSLIWSAIKAIWVENISMNGVGLMRLTFEPMTKLFLADFGSLSAVAIFEILLRSVTAVKSLIQNTITPLMYIGARRQVSLSHDQVIAFESAQRLIASTASHVTIAISLLAPIISILLFGELNSEVISFLSILSLSTSINLLGIVGYYVALSGGQVGQIFSIHVAMVVINLGLGPFLGWWFGAIGVVYAYGATLSVGGILSLQLLRPVDKLKCLHRAWSFASLALVIIAFTYSQGFGYVSPDHHFVVVVCGALVGIAVTINFGRIIWRTLRSRIL